MNTRVEWQGRLEVRDPGCTRGRPQGTRAREMLVYRMSEQLDDTLSNESRGLSRCAVVAQR